MELITSNLPLLGKALAALLVLALVLNVTWHATVPRLRLGVSDTLAKTERHGHLWLPTSDGGHSQKPFSVDNVAAIENPSPRVLRSLMDQAHNLGYVPDHVEIVINGKTRVYKSGGPTQTPQLLYHS